MNSKPILIFLFLIASLSLSAQESSSSHTGRIKGGFCFEIGPVFPTGLFKSGQVSVDNSEFPPYKHTFYPAKTGFGMDMGYLIYLGPAFAGKYLRAGIDATFFTFWFNKAENPLGYSKAYEYWYFFGGQKFGPLITVNPVDRLMFDFSYKIGFYGGYYMDDWGLGFWQSEVGMNVRYSLMMVGLRYGWGNINYNNYSSSSNPDRIAEVSTFRVLIGVKF
jgi:hypothetical protein